MKNRTSTPDFHIRVGRRPSACDPKEGRERFEALGLSEVQIRAPRNVSGARALVFSRMDARIEPTWTADAALMKAVAAGDDIAFAKLHARLYPKLVRLATSVTGDRESARDIVQEVFLKLWRQAGAWEPRATVDTWMWKVTLRECLGVRRRLGRALFDVRSAAPRDPHASAVDREAHARLRRLIGDLSPRDRALVTLHLDEQREPREIAELLGMSDGACRTALSRALARVKERMEVTQ
jgi:RNA polymerase sigma-70 factor (ECF subfamily)